MPQIETARCEWPECKEAVAFWLGYTGYDPTTSSVRFIRTKGFCVGHLTEYRKTHPDAGMVEHIQ